MRLFTLLFLLAYGVLASGCSPLKGYPGPERPDSEVTIVKPAGDYDALFGTASIDGVTFTTWGIAVLPGKHEVRLVWRFKGDPRNCEKYTELDQIGYSNCLARDEKDRNCTCWDYVTVYQRCLHDLKVVECQGDFEGAPGESYQLGMTGDYNSPKAELRSSRRGWVLACAEIGLEQTNMTTLLGMGYYAAVNAGVSASSECLFRW
ncbi:MAG: hypothetical protein ACK5GN_05355 [Pseudomonadota bacterium]|jgi:hypothetical protein